MPQPPVTPPKPSVLIVDDNVDAADSLALLLEANGHAVRTAADGAGALAAFDQSPADAVVLDLWMPGLSGFDVARELRRRAGGRPLLILAVTGLTRDGDRAAAAAAAGVDAFLVKPADPADVLARLAAMGPGRVAPPPPPPA